MSISRYICSHLRGRLQLLVLLVASTVLAATLGLPSRIPMHRTVHTYRKADPGGSKQSEAVSVELLRQKQDVRDTAIAVPPHAAVYKQNSKADEHYSAVPSSLAVVTAADVRGNASSGRSSKWSWLKSRVPFWLQLSARFHDRVGFSWRHKLQGVGNVYAAAASHLADTRLPTGRQQLQLQQMHHSHHHSSRRLQQPKPPEITLQELLASIEVSSDGSGGVTVTMPAVPPPPPPPPPAGNTSSSSGDSSGDSSSSNSTTQRTDDSSSSSSSNSAEDQGLPPIVVNVKISDLFPQEQQQQDGGRKLLRSSSTDTPAAAAATTAAASSPASDYMAQLDAATAAELQQLTGEQDPQLRTDAAAASVTLCDLFGPRRAGCPGDAKGRKRHMMAAATGESEPTQQQQQQANILAAAAAVVEKVQFWKRLPVRYSSSKQQPILLQDVAEPAAAAGVVPQQQQQPMTAAEAAAAVQAMGYKLFTMLPWPAQLSSSSSNINSSHSAAAVADTPQSSSSNSSSSSSVSGRVLQQGLVGNASTDQQAQAFAAWADQASTTDKQNMATLLGDSFDSSTTAAAAASIPMLTIDEVVESPAPGSSSSQAAAAPVPTVGFPATTANTGDTHGRKLLQSQSSSSSSSVAAVAAASIRGGRHMLLHDSSSGSSRVRQLLQADSDWECTTLACWQAGASHQDAEALQQLLGSQEREQNGGDGSIRLADIAGKRRLLHSSSSSSSSRSQARQLLDADADLSRWQASASAEDAEALQQLLGGHTDQSQDDTTIKLSDIPGRRKLQQHSSSSSGPRQLRGTDEELNRWKERASAADAEAMNQLRGERQQQQQHGSRDDNAENVKLSDVRDNGNGRRMLLHSGGSSIAGRQLLDTASSSRALQTSTSSSLRLSDIQGSRRTLLQRGSGTVSSSNAPDDSSSSSGVYDGLSQWLRDASQQDREYMLQLLGGGNNNG